MEFLLSAGWGWEDIFLATAFPKSARCFAEVHGHDTWSLLWKYISLSLQAGYDGVFPERDPDGNVWPPDSYQQKMASCDIADGEYFMVLWSIACDTDFASNELGIQHHAAASCCSWCPATLDDVRDFRETSHWQQHVYSLDFSPPLPGHILFSLPGMTH